MPTLLPAETHVKLKQALKTDRVPEPRTPEYDTFFDTWEELNMLLYEDLHNADAPAARRDVGAIAAFWSAIPFSGVLVGIACNQPEIMPIARQAAINMNLPGLVVLIDKVIANIPPQIQTMDDPSTRLSWYTEGEGQQFAEQLTSLDDEIQSSEEVNNLLMACMKRMLAEPTHFFAT